jgi:hypothetical protein
MNDLMEKAKALASARAETTSSKWLRRDDFHLAVEDMVESGLTYDQWKSEIAKGTRLVNNKLVYLAAWLQWFKEQ